MKLRTVTTNPSANTRAWTIVAAVLVAIVLPTHGLAEQRGVPRISYWSGKVNQHYDLASHTWATDPDGRSGAEIDMVTYCRRWYPRTISVRPHSMERISTWRSAGNTGAFTSNRQSYECVQPPRAVPRIMYWSGKVNQHFDLATGSWISDPDGRSGADIDMVTYCRRWYPRTLSVRSHSMERISTWRAAGNTGAFASERQSYECIQP